MDSVLVLLYHVHLRKLITIFLLNIFTLKFLELSFNWEGGNGLSRNYSVHPQTGGKTFAPASKTGIFAWEEKQNITDNKEK